MPGFHRRFRHQRLASLALLAVAAQAAHAFDVPECSALRDWSSAADVRDTSYALAARIGLPAYFAPEVSTRVFGVPAADWSADQQAAVQARLAECQRGARQARDRDGAALFKSAGASLKSLQKGRKAVENARTAVHTHVAELGALPASAELAVAVDALAGMDPASPKPIRGLSRELGGPVGGLLKALPDLPAADHQALVSRLQAIAGGAWEGLASALDRAIDAAGAGAAGLLAVQEVRLRALEHAAQPRVAAVVARADEWIGQRRVALGEAGGQWVPPVCVALYDWSSAADARERLALGTQSTYRLFADATSGPVFGKPLVGWDDDELAAFATLRGLCAREWRLQLDTVPARRLDQVGDDAPALLRAARTGSWIDDADTVIVQGRERLQAYRAATAALAEATGVAAGLPVERASLDRLAGLAGLPAQQALDGEERRAYQAKIRARRDEIVLALVNGVVAGADALSINRLADLPQLWRYGAEAAQSLNDREVLARLQPAWELAITRHLDRLQPEFEQRLGAMPVSLPGMKQAWDAVETLTGARGAHDQRPFAAYRLAAARQVRVIHDSLQARYCAEERDRLGLDGSDGRQPVWDGDQGMPLGDVACAMAAAGNPMSEYDGPGLVSRAQRFKADVGGYGYHTLDLHRAEVAAGTEMLLGNRLADANGERALSVQQWLGYLAQATRPPYPAAPRCKEAVVTDNADPAPAEGLLALRCLLPALQAGR